jgi:hypothetical protein
LPTRDRIESGQLAVGPDERHQRLADRLLRGFGTRSCCAAALAMASMLLAANTANLPATPAAAPGPASLSGLALRVDQADAQAQRISAGAHLRSVDDAGLRWRLDAIPAIESELDDALASLEPRLESADAKLSELGPPPRLGQPPEDPEIAQERQNILAARRAIDTEVKQAHLVGIEVKQLETYLVTRRRELFSERLWQRDRSPLDYRFWGDLGGAWPLNAAHIAGVIDGSGLASADGAQVVELGGTTLFALLLLLGGRVMLDHWGIARADRIGTPTSLNRSLLSLWFIVGALITSLIAGVILRTGFQLILPSASTPGEALLAMLVRILVFASLIAALGRALLLPDRPDWRPAPFPDALAKRIRRFPNLFGLAFGTTAFVSGAAAIVGADAHGEWRRIRPHRTGCRPRRLASPLGHRAAGKLDRSVRRARRDGARLHPTGRLHPSRGDLGRDCAGDLVPAHHAHRRGAAKAGRSGRSRRGIPGPRARPVGRGPPADRGTAIRAGACSRAPARVDGHMGSVRGNR